MIQIFISVTVGVITGVASSWLSFLVFRAQRVWERREAAYKEILQALQQMKSAVDEEYQYEITHRTPSDEYASQLVQRWRAGREIAYRYADVGSLELNEAVEAALCEMV